MYGIIVLVGSMHTLNNIKESILQPVNVLGLKKALSRMHLNNLMGLINVRV
tara:strand:+ start:725 stop:877 length:153 start_codon:yes stop_codon:yes gene_type:complete